MFKPWMFENLEEIEDGRIKFVMTVEFQETPKWGRVRRRRELYFL
jgi:hypothetical protein